jgi:multidrug resistance efflux pump
MALILIALWLAFLQLLVKFKVLNGWATWMKASPALIYLAFLLIVAIPMNFIAPKGAVVVLRETVPIAPEVSGSVIDVHVYANTQIEKGQLLFSINPVPYQAKVDALQSQIDLTQIRLTQAKELIKRKVGRQIDVEQYQAQLRQLQANQKGAQLDLDNTQVLSALTGVIPYVGLEAGAVVTSMQPVMSIINSQRYVLGAVIAQNHLRHIKSGQAADVVLKLFPGQTFKAKVEKIVQQAKGGQIKTSGSELDLTSVTEQPFMVVLSLELDKLNDIDKAKLVTLPAGAFGSAVIYTNNMKSIGEKIQAIMLRTTTWMNYL